MERTVLLSVTSIAEVIFFLLLAILEHVSNNCFCNIYDRTVILVSVVLIVNY